MLNLRAFERRRCIPTKTAEFIIQTRSSHLPQETRQPPETTASLDRIHVDSTDVQLRQRGRPEVDKFSDITAWITDDVTTTTKTTTATTRTTSATTTKTTTGCRRHRLLFPLGSEVCANPLEVDVINDDVFAIATSRLNVRRFERNYGGTRR